MPSDLETVLSACDAKLKIVVAKCDNYADLLDQFTEDALREVLSELDLSGLKSFNIDELVEKIIRELIRAVQDIPVDERMIKRTNGEVYTFALNTISAYISDHLSRQENIARGNY